MDRSKLPEPGPPPKVRFPKFQRATLRNGLNLMVIENKAIPQVNLNLIIDAGYASDQFALAGTASLAMAMLDEGTKTRNALQISDELDLLGANLNTGSDLDVSTVSLSALKDHLDASLELYTDVILNPSFPADELERQRRLRLAQIQQERAQPFAMALRVFPKLLYGEKHAYGKPFTGSGFAETVQQMTREDLVKFHRAWFKPNHSTLVIVGDTTLAEIQPKLEKFFAGWEPGDVPVKDLRSVKRADQPSLYIVDRPGSIQSFILAGHIAPPRNNPDEIAITAMNTVLGGSFTARINMNLREDKHWSYGAQSVLVPSRGQSPFIVVAPVQTDKTAESVREVLKELTSVGADKPATDEELDHAKKSLTLTLPGLWESMSAMGSSLGQLVRFGLSDDYWSNYARRVEAVNLKQVNDAATSVVHPDSLVWVIVGDREKIEAGLRELNIGAIRLLDPDGNIQTGNPQI